MPASMRPIEKWKDSAEYKQAQRLFEELMRADDDTVALVQLIVWKTAPDHTEGTDCVTWIRRYESVEE